MTEIKHKILSIYYFRFTADLKTDTCCKISKCNANETEKCWEIFNIHLNRYVLMCNECAIYNEEYKKWKIKYTNKWKKSVLVKNYIKMTLEKGDVRLIFKKTDPHLHNVIYKRLYHLFLNNDIKWKLVV
jgi:hypothetical protein